MKTSQQIRPNSIKSIDFQNSLNAFKDTILNISLTGHGKRKT